MMKSFEVRVKAASVEIHWVGHVSVVHARGVVDGVPHLYKIVKDKIDKPTDSGWFERGMVNVHYHACNQGGYCRFESVEKTRKSKSKKVAAEQMSLL